MNAKKKFRVEKSAGGLAVLKRAGRTQVLMVEVKNLAGEIVWTFPKGHLEAKETNEEAAMREVEEETGWLCEIVQYGKKTHFEKVVYFFNHQETLIRKEVVWFLMKPLRKTGSKDPDEIRKVKWFDLKEAKKKVEYPSDKKLVNKLEPWLAEKLR